MPIPPRKSQPFGAKCFLTESLPESRQTGELVKRLRGLPNRSLCQSGFRTTNIWKPARLEGTVTPICANFCDDQRDAASANLMTSGEPTSGIGREIGHQGRSLGLRDVLVLSHCNGSMDAFLSRTITTPAGTRQPWFTAEPEGEQVVQAKLSYQVGHVFSWRRSNFGRARWEARRSQVLVARRLA